MDVRAYSEVGNENLSQYLEKSQELESALKLVGEDLPGRFDQNEFLRLAPERQLHVIGALTRMRSVLGVLGEESSVTILGRHEGHFYIRTALKKFGWKVDANVFEHVGPRDSIEIYGPDCTLTVANLRFLELCSYSLEKALSHEFFELFDRDASITAELVKMHGRALIDEKNCFKNPVSGHYVYEKASLERRQFWMEPKVLAPVLGPSRKPVAVIIASSVRMVASTQS